MSTIEKIKREIKNTKLLLTGLKNVESGYIVNMCDGVPRKMEESVFTSLSKIETNIGGQITGKVTIAISDSFMRWLVYHGNDYLKSVGSRLRIISRDEVIDKPNVEFDVVFEMDGQYGFFEIKFSQNKNKTQGATHGKNKVNDFIIIEFQFDMNRVITDDNRGILGDVWIGFTKGKPKFIGEASEKSSRTTFSYTYEEYSLQDMENCVIFGSFEMKGKSSKIYKLIRKNLYE
jgi:hypothetical protein